MYTMLCSVSGIQNKECKTQIKNALNKLDGVNEVGVNLNSGTVEIRYNDPATENELKNCIEKTGFKIQYE
ncbi:MAG: heavy-metal-associated domain-containing protein [Oscillospiraceae bacterium]|nr:heavy-metal-associated domain-containing protein [Oscillospiraceae bacterium]